MKDESRIIQQDAKANAVRESLRRVAACATPGTPENKAYHAALARIHALALQIRKERQ